MITNVPISVEKCSEIDALKKKKMFLENKKAFYICIR